LKKRHASLHQHQPTNRVNKFLAQAIEARSMGQEKSNHALTLCFRDSLKLGTSKWPSIHRVDFIIFNVDNFCWNCFCRRTVPTGCGQQFRQFLRLQFGASRLFGRRPVGRFASNEAEAGHYPNWRHRHDAMMKQPNHHNSNLMASMYGGVITPLALVHQQIRQQNITNKWAILWFNSDQLVGATAAEYGSRDYAARSSSSGEISSAFWRNYSPTFDSSSSTQFFVQEVMLTWVPLHEKWK
jgi:hypothetical protein